MLPVNGHELTTSLDAAPPAGYQLADRNSVVSSVTFKSQPTYAPDFYRFVDSKTLATWASDGSNSLVIWNCLKQTLESVECTQRFAVATTDFVVDNKMNIREHDDHLLITSIKTTGTDLIFIGFFSLVDGSAANVDPLDELYPGSKVLPGFKPVLALRSVSKPSGADSEFGR